MDKVKLFKNGKNQAVRLPKEYNFDTKEVYIKKLDGAILLIPKDSDWSNLEASLNSFSEDFMLKREQPSIQVREDLE